MNQQFGEEKTQLFIIDLLRSIPSFLGGLGNIGVLEEIHFGIRAFEHDLEYKWYRKQQPPHPYDREEYKAAHQKPSNDELRYAAVLGFVAVLEDVLNHTHTVHHGEVGYYHRFPEPVELQDTLILLSQHVIHAPIDFIRQDLEKLVDTGIDLYPIYLFVFLHLRERGYNWEYRADLLSSGEYFDFVKEGPEPAVRAYTDIFGTDPKGYPPRLEDY